MKLKLIGAAAIAVSTPGLAFADTLEELMTTRLGTTEAHPAIVEAFTRAAEPVTEELRAKALECWENNSCDTGTGGELTVAYADGFGENVWRRVTAMEFFQQALTYPEVGRIMYSSARGDAAQAISDLRSFIAQDVDVIVIFADHGEALGPTVREARDAGIQVVLSGGTEVGTAGADYLANVSENIAALGEAFIDTVLEANPDARDIVALGGTPGNPLSATWQASARERTAEYDGVEVIAAEDTNWTQEGAFSAVSALLSRFDNIDAYIYDYADGFRGGVRAYESADEPLDFVLTLRTDEQGLFCDWERHKDDGFRIFYASGQNFQARIALTAGIMGHEGQEVEPIVDVPFAMHEVEEGMCDTTLPMEVSASTLVDGETLRAMFGG